MAPLKPNTTKPATTLKRKREEERDDDTFFKNNLGLFNKVTELSIFCEGETTMIVSTQSGKLYACGYPSPDVVIQQFLSGSCPQEHACVDKKNLEILRMQHEALEEKFKEEKEKLDVIEAQKVGLSSPLWWNNDIEEMSLEDLEKFEASLEQLKLGLVLAKEEKRIKKMQPMPMPLPVVPPMASLDQFAAQEENRINSMQPMPMPLPMVPPMASWEQLQFGLVAVEEEKRINSMQPMFMPMSEVLPPISTLSNHVPMFNGYFSGHQVLDWNNGIGRSNSNVATVSNGFNHYYVKEQGRPS